MLTKSFSRQNLPNESNKQYINIMITKKETKLNDVTAISIFIMLLVM
jgi:hypothetical protein